MRDSEFEWYDAKASANLRKHGVSFEMARLVFRDNYAVDTVDLRQSYEEERLNRVAYAGDALLFVIYTMRGERTRIMSARRPNRDEIEFYISENDLR